MIKHKWKLTEFICTNTKQCDAFIAVTHHGKTNFTNPKCPICLSSLMCIGEELMEEK